METMGSSGDGAAEVTERMGGVGSADRESRTGMNGYFRTREAFALYRLMAGAGGPPR